MRLKRLGCCIFAILLALPLMAPPVDTYAAKGRFTDTAGHWAEKYINTAVDEKIISGYPDGRSMWSGTATARPSAPVIPI